MVPDPMPSRRTVAVVALLVVGVALSFSFHATVGGMQAQYTATPVDQETNATAIASAAANVTDLDARLEGAPDRATTFVDRAIRTGTASGTVPPQLYTVLENVHAPYGAYDGRLYRWSVTTSAGSTTDVTLQMQRVSTQTVVTALAKPYRNASKTVRSAIDEGTVTADTTRLGIYTKDGTDFLVAPTHPGAIVSQLFEGVLGYLFTPVGRGFVAVAVGILAFQYREPTRDRILTPRRAVAVATLAIPVAVVSTLVFETGSLTRLIRQPASAFVVSLGVVAGVYVHRHQWGRLLGVTALAIAIPVVAGAAVLGIVGAIFGILGGVFGLLTGVVSLGYGAVFAVDPVDDG